MTIGSWDTFTNEEAEYCTELLASPAVEKWATSLIRRIGESGGVCKETMSLLFELRFGCELSNADVAPSYEIAGECESTIDFGFSNADQYWKVELVRLEETDAVQAATSSSRDQSGFEFVHIGLSSSASDPKRSEEGEFVKAVERICEKCQKDGSPSKFPMPNASFHMLLVDIRTFLLGISDDHDLLHLAYGASFVKSQFRRSWNGKSITGVFSKETSTKGARYLRERVHFIGLVNETKYGVGNFGESTSLFANPHLFDSLDSIKSAIESWPLGRKRIYHVKQK